MIFPFKQTNFPNIPFVRDSRNKYKFIVEYGAPVDIKSYSTDGAIKQFLGMGWEVDDILAIECYK